MINELESKHLLNNIEHPGLVFLKSCYINPWANSWKNLWWTNIGLCLS